MEINEKFEYEFSFSQEDVNLFAVVTGDYNPIHIDEDKASRTVFKRRIIHGYLSSSIFSKVFGTIWPGSGTIFLNQTLNFLKPMYPEEKYLARFEVIAILSKNKFKIRTTVVDILNEPTIDGDAVIKYDSNIMN